jgi:hypothetical protein
MNTYGIRQWARESYAVQWGYTCLATTAGRWQVRQGQNLAALATLLRGWRAATLVGFDPAGVSAVHRVIRRTCFRDGRLVPASENALVTEFLQTTQARSIREMFAEFSLANRVRLRLPRDEDPERQGNLIVLKRHQPETGEKGVIFVKYSKSFPWFAAVYDLGALASRYTIVLEPCWVGYQDWPFLLYLGRDLDVVVLAPYPPDFDYIQALGDTNLTPVRLGAGDWVDPDTFQPGSKTGRSFDLAMVSAWNPVKRHEVLFRTLAKLNRQGHPELRVALVGYTSVWTRKDIENLIRKYGLQEQCVVFDGIPHAEVAKVVADSRLFLLLSAKEGTNKSVYESLFCDTPVIVHREHQGGVMRDAFPPDVGILASDDELGDAIRRMLEFPGQFRPREWALAHTGWPRSTQRLNEALAELARRRNQPWSQPIVPKKNGPNLRYAEPGRYREFDEEYAGLERYLRP